MTDLRGTGMSEFGFTVVGQSIETLAREKLRLVKGRMATSFVSLSFGEANWDAEGRAERKGASWKQLEKVLLTQDEKRHLPLDDYCRGDLVLIEGEGRTLALQAKLARKNCAGGVAAAGPARERGLPCDCRCGRSGRTDQRGAVGDDWGMYAWSLDFAKSLPEGKRRESLLYALPLRQIWLLRRGNPGLSIKMQPEGSAQLAKIATFLGCQGLAIEDRGSLPGR